MINLQTGEILTDLTYSGLGGVQTPRIHSKLTDLPSKGQDMIDLATELGINLMEWQRYVCIHGHKVRPDGRWAHSELGLIMARQQGKSTLMMLRILTGMFVWGEGLQLASAHRLTTSLETFRQIVGLIETNPRLEKEVKKIRWQHGAEEIELFGNRRFVVKAANNAARGLSKPETIHLDELREYKDEDAWSSMRYSMMAAKNPQVWIYSSAGDQHSVILNKLRERALASATTNDPIGWFEWSAEPDAPILLPSGEINWDAFAQANPSLGITIHPDNLKAVINDPPDIVRTEVLAQWVDTINSAIDAQKWGLCQTDPIPLDPEAPTWLGLDLSPDRKFGALVATQKLSGERFNLVLLHTWSNDYSLNDLAVANDIAPYVRRYNTQTVAYSKRTAQAVASRLVPAGIPITDMDGAIYAESCDRWLGAINSHRLQHGGQEELTQQTLSAAKLPFGDGSWVIGRRASRVAVCAAVASALATYFATQPETEIDIQVG
ncbi:Terminase large subunit, Lambdalikevirus-type [uncultured Caudovirales phage]|uniref:Terminase large subunit, Lambdalikevirus-type n=1 Tax=uncultured Caudovirales phage TaxID=2100421 RepID=A0A6J5MAX2_9CAUD|nr:Terminase large subunit, Lambdalikevirus-type [uncultured Caudovirales phage]